MIYFLQSDVLTIATGPIITAAVIALAIQLLLLYLIISASVVAALKKQNRIFPAIKLAEANKNGISTYNIKLAKKYLDYQDNLNSYPDYEKEKRVLQIKECWAKEVPEEDLK